MYRPFPREQLERTRRDLWFQVVAEHVRPQCESEPYVADRARAAALPREARAIYFLWMFHAEAGGSGIGDFLAQQLGVFALQVHEALTCVGASELVERLEAGIPLALATGCTEIDADHPDHGWFVRFGVSPLYPTLAAVDAGIDELTGTALRDAANAFIERHQAELVG